MLDPRYHNYFSCIFHSHKEEGLKGLYRGFGPHLLATALVMTIVPFVSDAMLQRSHLYGVDKHAENEDLLDEVMEGKKRIEQKRKQYK